MTSHMKYESNAFANIAVLTIEGGKGDCDREEEAAAVGGRFLRAAALLPENEVLGWQISAGEGKQAAGYAFSSSGVKVTQEDFRWIFQGCGIAGKSPAAQMEDVFGENRKVYALLPVPGSVTAGGAKNADAASEGEGPSYPGSGYGDLAARSYFSDMLNMLTRADAIVCVIAGSFGGDTAGQGTVLVSVPGEMSLRMRTIISFALPGVAAKDMPSEGFEVDKLLPAEVVQRIMTGFLLASVRKASEETSAGREDTGDEAEQGDVVNDAQALVPDADKCDEKAGAQSETTFTPLEELDLSFRSYNCLKRAGVYSVEKLKAMTDEDLWEIRNIGSRSFDEVKQKLAAFEENAVAVPLEGKSYMAMLDELIGLDDVKEQVRKIAAFANMKKELAARHGNSLSMTLNMEFTGNPGTAKTTVARIVAGIFNEVGLLPGNELIEVGRADLVAKYEGQTASKVKEVFRKAKGKVLFIDEAYSLVEVWDDGYGDEAISSIVQEMENHREDTVVIFAGYPDKMEAFFSRNPGLRSRVPFRIAFQDYSAEDMLKIAELEAGKRGFSIGSDAKDKVMSICESAAGMPEAGNGRFCRNLVEHAILGYAARVYGGKGQGVEADLELAEEDFAGFKTTTANKPKPIGFQAGRRQ